MNHKRIARVTKSHGLGIRPRRRFVRTTDSDHDLPIDTQLALAALDAAVRSRQPAAGCIDHTDRGCRGEFNGSSQHWVDEQILNPHSMPRQVSSSQAFSAAWCRARVQRLRSLEHPTETGQCPLGSIAAGGRLYSRSCRAAMERPD